MSLTSCNNLTVNNNCTVNGNILGSGYIQTSGNIQGANITGSGNISTNNLSFTGLINNSVSPLNISTLDTSGSIQTSLNTINTKITALQSTTQNIYNSSTTGGYWQVGTLTYNYPSTLGALCILKFGVNEVFTSSDAIGEATLLFQSNNINSTQYSCTWSDGYTDNTYFIPSLPSGFWLYNGLVNNTYSYTLYLQTASFHCSMGVFARGYNCTWTTNMVYYGSTAPTGTTVPINSQRNMFCNSTTLFGTLNCTDVLYSTANSGNNTLSNLITTIQGKQTTDETNITTLQGQMTTANTNISTIQGKQSTDETNISTLQSQMSTVQSKQTTDETNITNLQSSVASNTTNVSSLLSHYQVNSGGNLKIETLAPSTTISLGINNGTQATIDTNGNFNIQNAEYSNGIELGVYDTTTTNKISVIPNTVAGGNNPIVADHSCGILASTGTINSAVLQIYPWANTASGITIKNNNLLLGSGTSTTSMPSNYIYIDNNSVNINTETSQVNYPLNVNGNIACSGEIELGGVFPVRGTINNNINLINTNATNIATLQTQVNALITTSIKAFGWFTFSAGSYVQISGSNYVQSFTLGTANGLTGLIITLKSSITNFQGSIQATAGSNGYVCVSSIISYNPCQFIIACWGGGSNPQVSYNDFLYSVI